MTPSIPIFRNEINALGNFREGVNIASEFTNKAAEIGIAGKRRSEKYKFNQLSSKQ